MKRILFVCHGNICRSPMAEFIMKKLVRQAGLENEFVIASAATSAEELGNPVYPMARQELAKHGIGCPGHKARILLPSDYKHYDMLIGMDSHNVRDMRSFFNNDPDGKVSLLLDHAGMHADISDPWYTRKFDVAWREIYTGCTALFNELTADAGTAD